MSSREGNPVTDATGNSGVPRRGQAPAGEMRAIYDILRQLRDVGAVAMTWHNQRYERAVHMGFIRCSPTVSAGGRFVWRMSPAGEVQARRWGLL